MKPYLFAVIALSTAVGATTSYSQTFFYVGPDGGSFFDLANWNDAADGTGANPAAGSIPDSTTGAIALDLVVEGVTVVAAGQVDFGAGSLDASSGATVQITGGGNDIDFNSSSSLTLTDSTLEADGDVVLEGTIGIANSIVTAVTDDVEFQDNALLTISNSDFSAGDNLFFDAFSGTITGGSFTMADRFGLRQLAGVVLTDVAIDVAGGTGDVDDAFDAAGAGSSLSLFGVSTLLADTVEEGVDLVLNDDSIATLGGNGTEVLDNGSLLTVTSTSAVLNIGAITDDPRASIINGLTGLSFLDDPSAWTVPGWNGLDAVTLQLVPEPTSALLLMTVSALSLSRRANR